MEALTEEQRAVVGRPAGSQTVVIAGPGTGKTHTLAARVRALLDDGAVEDPDDVLVLSFTRVAVAELRKRLEDHSLARLVRPQTLDSYARALVQETANAVVGGFDLVVRCAADHLETQIELGRFAHVVVDEAQDLVGDRLRLVLALLTRAGGFTVLGDPAQGIYGWQDRSSGVQATDAVIEAFPTALVCELTLDHRTRSDRARLVPWSRGQVADGASESLLEEMRRALRGAQTLSAEALTLVLRHAGAETAVLCRTNADVLRLSMDLRREGVDHRIQPASQAATPPSWLADLLGDCDETTLTRATLSDLGSPLDEPTLDLLWSEMVRVTGIAGSSIPASQVRARAGELSDMAADRAVPLLSTVHRSKGLEFDRVIVVDLPPRDDADIAEEARILFVAMTRARDETLLVKRQRPGFRMRRRSGRWLGSPWNQDTVTAVEIRLGDVDRSSPLTDEGSAAFIQRHLRTRVRPGDAVVVETHRRHGQAEYLVMHKGLVIARLQQAAASVLAEIGFIGGTLTGLVVECLSSAVGDPVLSDAVDAGRGGLWLVPEIAGFARVGI